MKAMLIIKVVDNEALITIKMISIFDYGLSVNRMLLEVYSENKFTPICNP